MQNCTLHIITAVMLETLAHLELLILVELGLTTGDDSITAVLLGTRLPRINEHTHILIGRTQQLLHYSNTLADFRKTVADEKNISASLPLGQPRLHHRARYQGMPGFDWDYYLPMITSGKRPYFQQQINRHPQLLSMTKK